MDIDMDKAERDVQKTLEKIDRLNGMEKFERDVENVSEKFERIIWHTAIAGGFVAWGSFVGFVAHQQGYGPLISVGAGILGAAGAAAFLFLMFYIINLLTTAFGIAFAEVIGGLSWVFERIPKPNASTKQGRITIALLTAQFAIILLYAVGVDLFGVGDLGSLMSYFLEGEWAAIWPELLPSIGLILQGAYIWVNKGDSGK